MSRRCKTATGPEQEVSPQYAIRNTAVGSLHAPLPYSPDLQPGRTFSFRSKRTRAEASNQPIAGYVNNDPSPSAAMA